MTTDKLTWGGFSKKTTAERIAHLQKHQLLSSAHCSQLANNVQLPLETAEQLVENTLGTFSLPFALVPDLVVDGQTYQVPFVTEEPSVVAAASYAAQLIKRSGGFTTKSSQREMIGQVALYDVPNKQTAEKTILEHKIDLLDLANDAYPSIVKRGGGARDISVTCKGEFLIVYLFVDTKEAMGANMINTMMEALVPLLESLSKGKSLMAILSNYAITSLVTANCRLKARFLSHDKNEAKELANKLVLASELAQVDVCRASTHNKGIFNGIDAVVLATGNDWRAIESGCHAFACHDGQYRGLSTWTIDEENGDIIGQLTLPMPVATKGGSIGLNPTATIAHQLLGNPNAKTLAAIIVSVGLAQNLAALKALISTGIQAGHMKLQAKSLALQAGAQPDQINQVVAQLYQEKNRNLETAKAILKMLNDKP